MLDKLVEWGVATRICEGEELSGDHYVVRADSGRVLVAAIDGIGHGRQAADASHAVAPILEASLDRSLVALMTDCHEALRNTRGVVMSLAAFDSREENMAWLGVGNVQGRLLHADGSGSHEAELLLRSGVVGHNLPATLDIGVLPVAGGDVLILATDGIHPEFTRDLYLGRPAQRIAGDILARHGRGTDDALVVVVKYRGDKASL